MNSFKIALAQFSPDTGNLTANAEKMLEQAQAKKVYSHLLQSELEQYFSQAKTMLLKSLLNSLILLFFQNSQL